MKSFLMLGQSNMAGRGEFGEVPEIINPRCFMLRNGRFQPMREPINCDRPIWGQVHSGIGLAASFADAFADTYEEEIGLIPCAEGASKLSEWMPGELLYQNAVCQTKLAMQSSEFAGILWHQGENDCEHPDRVAIYKARFHIFYETLLSDLGVGIGKLPFLIGGLGEFGGEPALKMNVLLKELSEEIPFCTYISSEGLPEKGDGAHFTSAAYRIFGVRYFEGLRKITGR